MSALVSLLASMLLARRPKLNSESLFVIDAASVLSVLTRPSHFLFTVIQHIVTKIVESYPNTNSLKFDFSITFDSQGLRYFVSTSQENMCACIILNGV